MIKIGDKVKFDTYLPHNYMTGMPLKKTLKDKTRIYLRGRSVLVRTETLTKFKAHIITETEQLEGIYVGPFRKKLIRTYKRTAVSTQRLPGESIITWMQRTNMPTPRFDRPTTNPRRVDDPRALDNMVMLKIGRRLIGVPMGNIYKCNFGYTFKVI
jgi:hypothetical protein